MDFITDKRRKVPYLPFAGDPKFGRAPVIHKALPERSDRPDQVLRNVYRRSQSLQCIPTFSDRLSGSLDHSVKQLLRIARSTPDQIPNGRKLHQKTLHTLEKRIVQFARYPGSLVDALLQAQMFRPLPVLDV